MVTGTAGTLRMINEINVTAAFVLSAVGAVSTALGTLARSVCKGAVYWTAWGGD